jgi:hypothetical protein
MDAPCQEINSNLVFRDFFAFGGPDGDASQQNRNNLGKLSSRPFSAVAYPL